MPAKYFNFIDGQRLPGARVKEFLMNQAVIQCANQTEITGSGIEVLGARVAINLEDGQLWTYAGTPAAWAPAQNALDLDLLDARYLTRIAADGIYLTETTANQKYLTEVTARGIFLTTSDADTKYYTKLQADGLFLTQTSGDSRYYTKLQADGLFLTETTADSKYITDLEAGNLFISKGGAAGDINANNTTINGGKITTNSITAAQISSNYVYAGFISADQINAGELVGRTIRTVPAGNTAKRIILNTAGEIVFFNAGTSLESGRIEATDNGLAVATRNGRQISFEPDGTQTAFVSSSGMGFNGLDKRWIGSLIATGGLQAGNGSVVLSSNGNISAASISGSSLSSSGGLNVTSGGASITGGVTATALISTGANIQAGNRFRQDTWDGFTGSTQAVHRRISDGFFGPSGSDIRLKENVEDLDKGLDFVNNLRPVKYTYKSETESPIINYGLIAQEVKPLVEENSNVVSGEETETNFLSIEYIQFVSPLIKAVQELSAKNDALEARLAALEGGAQ